MIYFAQRLHNVLQCGTDISDHHVLCESRCWWFRNSNSLYFHLWLCCSRSPAFYFGACLSPFLSIPFTPNPSLHSQAENAKIMHPFKHWARTRRENKSLHGQKWCKRAEDDFTLVNSTTACCTFRYIFLLISYSEWRTTFTCGLPRVHECYSLNAEALQQQQMFLSAYFPALILCETNQPNYTFSLS